MNDVLTFLHWPQEQYHKKYGTESPHKTSGAAALQFLKERVVPLEPKETNITPIPKKEHKDIWGITEL